MKSFPGSRTFCINAKKRPLRKVFSESMRHPHRGRRTDSLLRRQKRQRPKTLPNRLAFHLDLFFGSSPLFPGVLPCLFREAPEGLPSLPSEGFFSPIFLGGIRQTLRSKPMRSVLPVFTRASLTRS